MKILLRILCNYQFTRHNFGRYDTRSPIAHSLTYTTRKCYHRRLYSQVWSASTVIQCCRAGRSPWMHAQQFQTKSTQQNTWDTYQEMDWVHCQLKDRWNMCGNNRWVLALLNNVCEISSIMMHYYIICTILDKINHSTILVCYIIYKSLIYTIKCQNRKLRIKSGWKLYALDLIPWRSR